MLFIFDFDSTLIELTGVDWKSVKAEVIEYGKSQGLDFDPSIHLVNLSNHLSDTQERKAHIDGIFRAHEKKAVEEGKFSVYESTIPTLKTLHALGHKTAIASNNTEATVAEVVEAAGLPVDAIRGRNSVFRPKPFPDMLRSLMEEFQVDKKETFMTGDNFWDEGSGRAAGVKTFIIKPGTLDISLFSPVV